MESSEHYRRSAFGFSAIMTDLARPRTYHEFLRMNPWLIGAAMKLLSSLQKLVDVTGIEPATSCLQSTRSPS
jgi:hypothetical protein